ncbi:MAG: SprB repeat-containing protein, partial [Bacteroidota bacterium]|nr:SprB repeat-containing protein [Bacteroidota bacterium]
MKQYLLFAIFLLINVFAAFAFDGNKPTDARESNEPLNLNYLNFTVNATVTDVSCNGGNDGEIIVNSITGGTSPYTYLWSTGVGETLNYIDTLIVGTYYVTITDNLNVSDVEIFTVIEPSIVSFGLSSIAHNNCFGDSDGYIVLIVNGGTTPYNYSWSNGTTQSNSISNLASGSYTLTVTDDNGCEETSQTYVITEPSEISIINSITDVSCFGGSDGAIDLTVSGGTSPYSYSWDNGETTQDISGLVAGNYVVTVTDNNSCTKTGSFFVSEPAILSVSGTASDVSCYGYSNGSINITPSGGTVPYSFNWSNGTITEDVINLNTGSYSVTITDNNSCTKTGSYSVGEPPILSVSGTASDASCYGYSNGSINITPAGGTAPYSFSWSNSATTEDVLSISAGTYSVTITDGNYCTKTGSYSVSEPPILLASGIATDALCNGDANGSINITPSGGTAPYSFSWSNGTTSEDITGLVAGNYVVSVFDTKNCLFTTSYLVSEPAVLDTTAATS